MKKYLILFVALTAFSCKSQQTYSLSYQGNTDIYKNNNHIKDFDGILNKFIGTWQWVDPANPNTYLIIELFKVEDWNANNVNNYYEDKILGNYKYVENGVIVTNTLTWNTFNDLHSATFPAIIASVRKTPFKDLYINMNDVAKSKTCKAHFNIIDSNASTLEATWKLISTDEIRVGTNLTPVQQGFSIPSDIILTKQ